MNLINGWDYDQSIRTIIDDVREFLEANNSKAYTYPEIVGEFTSSIVPTVDGSASLDSISATDPMGRVTEGAQMMAKIEHYRLILELLVREGIIEKGMHEELQGKEPYYRANQSE